VELKQRYPFAVALIFSRFNRTIVELKPKIVDPDNGAGTGFNRTIVELKQERIKTAMSYQVSFNRTIVELKL